MDHIVAVGETETSDKMNVFPGGKGLNQSIALARAGGEVCHAGCIGEDGDLLLELLKSSGVDVSGVKRVDGKNGHAIIQVSAHGDNSIFIYPGSNARITPEFADETLSHFERGDIILLQNELNAVDYIVEKAIEFKLGARGLRSIAETIMMDAMFDMPSSDEKTLHITRKYAEEKLKKANMHALH